MTYPDGSAWDSGEPRAPRPAAEAWIDQLTSLHVLSAHGDLEADAQARDWIASDPEARRVWNTIADTCQAVPRDGGR